MNKVKTLCTFCGVVDQVTVSADGTARGTGRLGTCVKGASFFQDHFGAHPRDVERFTSPLFRTPYGWERVSWDYAIDMLADTILADRQEFGRDALAFYGVGQMTMEALWVAKRFFQGHLGTNNICSNAEQCLANNAGGHELVFGNEGSFSCYEDYLHAGAIILYGHNPAANHPTIFNRYIRKNTDAVKVVIDPRRTDTAYKLLGDSDRNIHLPVKSGSDILLNCLIARVLIDEGAHDARYLAANVDPDSAARMLAFLRDGPFTMDEVIPRITPADMDGAEMARRVRRVCDLWKHERVVTTSSVGINQTVGSSGIASILNLHLLTGNIGQPGRGHVRLAGQSNASSELAMGYSGRLLPFRMRIANPDHRATMARLWDLPPWKLNPRPGLPVASFATSERLRTMFIFGTNPARNFPNLARWRDKLMDLFVVYVDPYYNPEILEYADIILPCRTKHETSGVFLNGERRLQWLQKVEEPPFEAWSDVRIVCSVAQRIAERLDSEGEERAHPDHYTDEEVEALVADRNGDLLPASLYKDFDYPVDDTGEPESAPIWDEILAASRGFYNEFVDGDGAPITLDRIQRDEGAQWGGVRRYLPADEARPGGPFPAIFEHDRHHAWLHVPPDELLVPFAHRDGHRFTLITGRGAMGKERHKHNVAMFNSSTATGSRLWPDENSVYMSPRDARAMEVRTGAYVALANHIGRIECRVEVTEDMPAGHLYLTFHPDKKGTHPNFLTDSDKIDAHTWQPLLKDTEVELIPLRGSAAEPGADTEANSEAAP
ncbi:molybdopterin oxidoreductase family protein [Haliangium sp.]|uniref:molybdopterin oxidoreductase family protein n=1 Tax=Haliangium sp. TaxID=2663208 RepID=UPI003D1448CD